VTHREQKRINNLRYKSRHREEIKKRDCIYRLKNKEKERIRHKKYREINKEKKRHDDKVYRENNIEKIRISRKEYNSRPEVKNHKKEYRKIRYLTNKGKVKRYNRIRYLKNKDRINTQNKKYRTENLKKCSIRNREYRKNNAEKIKLQNRAYKQSSKYKKRRKLRLKTDPLFKLNYILSRAVCKSLKSIKCYKTKGWKETVGYDNIQLKKHLENQFAPEMNWNNYGIYWHIDHKIPCALFNVNDPEELKKCNHYTNLQLLWWEDNIRKGDKYD